MVEHTTHNRAVAGSIPASATNLAELIDGSGLVPAGSRVLVALSGGPDSTALLLSLRELGRDVVAAHYDHALRPGSEREAALVGAFCDRHRVPLVAERCSLPLARGSVMAAARAARYEFLERARQAREAEAIATAHTLDDQLETVLINLIRGTGIRGLAGIPARRGRIVRPLLAATRAQILDYLEERGEAGLSDPSNHDRRYLRVRVRSLLLPALERRHPDIREALAGLAASAGRAATRERPGAGREELAAAHPARRASMLSALYAVVAGDGLRRVHLAALERLTGVRWATGAALDLPRGIRFRVLPEGVAFERVPAEPPARATYELRVFQCSGCHGADAVHLKPGSYAVGHRSPGLRMRPEGAPGTRKVQDILTDARVPRAERDALPLVFRDGRPAWIPGVTVDPAHTTRQASPGIHVTLVQRAAKAPSDGEGPESAGAKIRRPTSRSFPPL